MKTTWKIGMLILVAGAAAGLTVLLTGQGDPVAGAAGEVVVYKSPVCSCCAEWVEHMEDAGFDVRVEHPRDLASVKGRLGVRPELSACHTAVVGDYVVEGHVPAADVKRLLQERPAGVAGLAVPGMPVGSPGMEGPGSDPYDVLTFDRRGGTAVYASY